MVNSVIWHTDYKSARAGLESGFSTGDGATFVARIDPSICNSSRSIVIDSLSKKETQISTNKNLIANNIEIYPNPNNGTFSVDFSKSDFKDYTLKLVNIDGSIISSINNIESSIITLTVPNISKGSCILYLFNEKNNTVVSRKIIIE